MGVHYLCCRSGPTLQDKWLRQRTAILSRDLFSGELSGAVYPPKTESLLADFVVFPFPSLLSTFRCPEREIKGFLGGGGTGRRGDYDVAGLMETDSRDDDRVGPLDRRCLRGRGGKRSF